MFNTVRLPSVAQHFNKFVKIQGMRSKQDPIFPRYADLFLFSVCYAKSKNLFKEAEFIPHEKTAIKYETFHQTDSIPYLLAVLLSHYNGNISVIEKSDDNAKILELYAQSGLTELAKDIDEYGIVTSMDFADHIASYLDEIT